MEYMEFLEAVRDYINETAQNVRVSIHSAVKNNGVKLSGLSFSEEGDNASPTIYMENYYAEYLNGTDIYEIGDRLTYLYRENNLALKLNMSFFDDFDLVRERLFIKLINKEKNTEFLKEAPYEDFLDLAIVPYVRIYDKRIGNGLIMVKNEHLKLWKTDAATILAIARKNTHDHEDYTIRSIMDVLTSIGTGNDFFSDDESDFPMYVATNRKMTNGAAVLTMNDKLREFAKVIGSDYYVIPSSVHEIILFPRTGKNDTGNIDEMIREVNRTQLGPDDVLSDHAYLYSANDEVLIF